MSMNVILLVIAGAFLIGYLMRRRVRLRNEDSVE